VTRSEQLFRRAQGIFVGGVNSPVRAFRAVGGTPVFFKSGRGSTLVDVDGRKYIDYVGSWGPLILGHAPSTVVDAARRTLQKGSSFGAPSPLELELAQRVQAVYPRVEQIRFTSSGTEACLSALVTATAFLWPPAVAPSLWATPRPPVFRPNWLVLPWFFPTTIRPR
jgi:glutamate-1-semialdehyde 2,1-aminomutase